MTQHYVIKEDEHKLQLQARFWNDDGNNITIVASITKKVDWAVYIGASIVYTEAEAIMNALEHGCKLVEKDARHFFSGDVSSDVNLDKLPYRQ